MVSSSDDPTIASTVAVCRFTIDVLNRDFDQEFPRLTEPFALAFASMFCAAVMRERQAVRLLTEDQKRQYSEDQLAAADDELRAEARTELEVIMARAMLRQVELDS
jgi:hypothetical protein